MLHTFVALVEDKPGVLTRVASLFRRLNINIVSLTVGESERPDTSRMTIVCDAHEHAADRIRASLYKLETTVHVDEVDRCWRCRPRALPDEDCCRTRLAEWPTLALADLRTRECLSRPRRRSRAGIHHAGDDRELQQNRRAWCRSSPSPATPSWKSPAPAAWPCGAAITPAACSPHSAANGPRIAMEASLAVSSMLTRSSLTNLKTCTRKRFSSLRNTNPQRFVACR